MPTDFLYFNTSSLNLQITNVDRITSSISFTTDLAVGVIDILNSWSWTYTLAFNDVNATAFVYHYYGDPGGAYGDPSYFVPTFTYDAGSQIGTFTMVFNREAGRGGSGAFPLLFTGNVQQTHTLQVNPPSHNYQTTPVIFTYSYFAISSFMPALDSDPEYILSQVGYVYGGFTTAASTTNLSYILNTTTTVANGNLTWSLSNDDNTIDNTVGDGIHYGLASGTVRYRITVVGPSIFLQSSQIKHTLRYYDSGPPIDINSNVDTVYIKGFDSNNIFLTTPMAIVNATVNKSIVLPPVNSSVGVPYHIKVTNVGASCELRISPYITTPITFPLQTTLYITNIIPFDSEIEDANSNSLYIINSAKTVTFVSSGTGWYIINKYSFATSGLSLNRGATLPGDQLNEPSDLTAFYVNYDGTNVSRRNILLFNMTNTHLKYIFIWNSSVTTTTFTIYLPSGAIYEDAARSPSYPSHNALSFDLPNGVAGLIMTYRNGRYYVLSATINPFFSTSAPNSTTLLTKTLTFIQNGTTGAQFPNILDLDTSTTRLFIVKCNSTYTPFFKGETPDILFLISAAVSTDFTLNSKEAVWMLPIKVSERQKYYLPVCYYTAT